jgi:pyruvate dehydrogenase E2 component (dihydrolipoamide acetyltransferase)
MGRESVVVVPDIGDFKDVEIIEILVNPGDTIKADDSLISLESDKAAMEIPSTQGGTVKELKVKLGDKVSQGSPILTLIVEDAAGEGAAANEEPPAPAPVAETKPEAESSAPKPEPIAVPPEPAPAAAAAPAPVPMPSAPAESRAGVPPHASPSVRRFARELGADLTRITGSGTKGRILKEDVQIYVKARLQQPERAPATVLGFPEPVEIDFSQFGAIDRQPLSRINKLSAAALHRAWVTIPHVTQHDEADITDLEEFRVSLKKEAERRDVKLTPLPLIMKAVVAALKAFPKFNASLAANGEELILKRYYHIGFAVDTPDGLVVPVLRDADQKSVFEIAAELGEMGVKARGRKLRNPDLQGGTFTISSLGGIGGTSFTPIVNAPEVAILGVSRAQTKPVYREGQFVPRLMLPLSLSYDHRVIDGAEAARFITHIVQMLADLRRILL